MAGVFPWHLGEGDGRLSGMCIWCFGEGFGPVAGRHLSCLAEELRLRLEEGYELEAGRLLWRLGEGLCRLW